MEYSQAKSGNVSNELGVEESTILQNLIYQFEKANAEQSGNCDRLMKLRDRLNLEPPSPEVPMDKIQRKGLTTGEGLLAAFEGMVSRYQETINIQHQIILKLERLI